MNKLDLPGSRTVALSVTEETLTAMYTFDTSDFDAGLLGAIYADLLHHRLLDPSPEPDEILNEKHTTLIYGWHFDPAHTAPEDFLYAGCAFLKLIMPYAKQALASVYPLVIARVGVILEPIDATNPVILLEFCEKANERVA